MYPSSQKTFAPIGHPPTTDRVTSSSISTGRPLSIIWFPSFSFKTQTFLAVWDWTGEKVVWIIYSYAFKKLTICFYSTLFHLQAFRKSIRLEGKKKIRHVSQGRYNHSVFGMSTGSFKHITSNYVTGMLCQACMGTRSWKLISGKA